MTEPKLNLKVEDTKEVTCDSCGNNTFEEVLFLREVSPLLSGQPKTAFMPINTFACAACGNVNEIFIPDALRESKIIEPVK